MTAFKASLPGHSDLVSQGRTQESAFYQQQSWESHITIKNKRASPMSGYRSLLAWVRCCVIVGK